MPEPGDYEFGLAGVRMYRRNETTEPHTCFYQPVIVKMVQGHKYVCIGADEDRY